MAVLGATAIVAIFILQVEDVVCDRKSVNTVGAKISLWKSVCVCVKDITNINMLHSGYSHKSEVSYLAHKCNFVAVHVCWAFFLSI